MIGGSNDKTSFLHKSLFTDRHVSRLCKAFANDSSANIKLSKTKLSKTAQLGRFIPLDSLKLVNSVEVIAN